VARRCRWGVRCPRPGRAVLTPRGGRAGAVRLAALLLVVGEASRAGTPAPARLERTVYAMGTQLRLEVEGPSEEVLRAATEAAIRESERIEAACSTWRQDSAWSRLNAAHGAEVPLDGEWLTLLDTILAWNRSTEGAFDPVLGALIHTWGLRHGGRTPSASELHAAREASGASLLLLDRGRGVARLRHPQAAVEEGGFLKGYALDRMAAVLRRSGVQAALLDFGGQLLAYGRPRAASLAAPEDRQRRTLELELREGSLSSSGTSEHGRHILDPATGERCPAWGSTAVLASEGLAADVLSTALYVLGPDRGLAWADRHQVAAVFQRPGQPPLLSERFRALQSHPDVAPRSSP
jgi:FAD:protein FMN transferase